MLRKRKSMPKVFGWDEELARLAQRSPPPEPTRTTTTVLGLEKRRVDRGGEAHELTTDELMDERLIERALTGDYRSIRDVYRALDEEEDDANRQPTLSAAKKREVNQGAAAHLREMRDQRDRLIELGLLEFTARGEVRIPLRVKAAMSRVGRLTQRVA